MWNVNIVRLTVVGVACAFSIACAGSNQSSTAQPSQPTPYGQQGQYPPNQSPPNAYPQNPQQPPVPPVAQRPLLAPLVGVAAWQQELRNVLAELVAALPAQSQGIVRNIPLVFDPTIEINAYAGCDERGAPLLAATAGILEAVDAIAQTKATDELFGTHTYDAYCNAVVPSLVQSDKARAALPAGIIPQNLGPDPRRWSRAHELYDELLAFTFGHELAHHYLGHTGCTSAPSALTVWSPVLRIPSFNQGAEAAADTWGTNNALDAGRRRRPQYEWNENGGVTLLDFFGRMDRAAGGNPLTNFFQQVFLRSHPNPALRIPLVQTTARVWHAQHPG